MRAYGTRSIVAVLALATLLFGGVAYYLAHSQTRMRRDAQDEFARRAQLTANLTSATLSASLLSDPADMTSDFGGGSATVEQSLRARVRAGDVFAAILSVNGDVVGVWPRRDRALASAYYDSPDVQGAIRGGGGVSDLIMWSQSTEPMIRLSSAFNTSQGVRIYVHLGSAYVVSLASAYLTDAPAVPGADAYLVDGNGRVLASTGTTLQGAPLPDPGLLAASRQRSSGNLGGSYFVTAPIGGGTRWHLILAAQRSRLLAQVESSRKAWWTLFGGFVLAVLALIAAGLKSLRTSARLLAVEERERTAQRLAHERLHDALTGLPNRALFLDRAGHALSRARRDDTALAVLFIDLDHFKRINDSLGHAAGDELLQEFAERLGDAIRPSDTLSRFGGDEFLILCEGMVDPDDALHVAQRIHALLEQPFRLGDREVHVSCSVGIALQRPGAAGVPGSTLVRNADAAMYAVKEHGRNGIRIFDDELHAVAMRRLDDEGALRTALRDGELAVHYQPLVELPSTRLCGAEALARWHRPAVGDVPPTEFIQLAEDCGLIDQIGGWVLGRAMQDAQDWSRQGLIDESFTLSVNVSPYQLAGREFVEDLERRLAAWELPATALCLEVTESAVVHEPSQIQQALHRLTALGIQLAIDDFGIGQSSLEQLVRSLPVDVLKLDRSFVAEMNHSRERAVVAAVGLMAGELGMSAIAEGVETREHAEHLVALGYPYAQGYLFGRPVDAAAFRAVLSDRQADSGHLRPAA
jgi:diguanylate cyclase (GGDEF)-like protein